ncbi:Retrovirus-related Pol polyprotein from transposon 297 [Vitis vinifera]|uniref:Retrovirus-related Pol polyprotein from transposon 297 n=1 Tax=Vitis vinifera TaxID=29760 RepID=A0A438GRP8_VITVI|nr:Retrovirus-related Pol polyprotein from transposon 297 [Vitis vinifera]
MHTVQEKGKFPSQPQQNPKGVHEIGEKNKNYVKVDEVKTIITLRGGKQVDQPMPKPKENKGGEQAENVKEQEKWKEVNEDDRSKQDEFVNEEIKKKDKLLSPPFPKALQSRKVVNNATEIFEVLKQVKVNIPLLDMIKQVPSYAKFLKDLCTMKRGLNINKKAFLTEQVSAIIQCKTLIKYKDPWCPTISVNIGDTYVEKALLDLGASVNLLPYSVYKQLGLGKLKPTSITLSLADRSIKIPRGISEDIWVQVDKFYYLVDFIVLDTEPIASEPNHAKERPLPLTNDEEAKKKESPKLNLKPFPNDLKYAYLEEDKYLVIEIALENQDKTTFTCPFGTHAYRRMPFGLCNALATFQICMLSFFSDMVERIMEVFMNDLTIYGEDFGDCLSNLETILQRCIEKNLVLNWEKCHFMVEKGIVLGHVISRKDIEVDKAKIELIVNLPPPTNVKEVRQFLGHAGFYKRFIKDFSKLARPMCALLAKDAKFKLDENCQHCFEE